MIFGGIMGGRGGNSLGGGWGVAGGFGRPGIFGIPGFANGTSSAPGGLAWVGERGPELVNLPRGSQVYPHQQSMAMAANSNAPQKVQIEVSISVDEGGNIVPLVRQVAGEEADIRVNSYNDGMANRIRDIGSNRWKGYTG
jgi:hypothetical protein